MNLFEIHPRAATVSAHIIEGFRLLPVANVSDMMTHHYEASAQLKPMYDTRAGNMAGPALTVRTAPAERFFVHEARDLAAPGDSLVVEAVEETTAANRCENIMN